MQYAIIKNGIVENVILADAEFAASIGAIEAQNASIGWSWDGAQFTAPSPPAPVVPQFVTMRQAVLALLDADMLDDIEAIVAALPRRYQLEWEPAANVYRDNALVEAVRHQKSMTNEQIDDLFIAAFAL